MKIAGFMLILTVLSMIILASFRYHMQEINAMQHINDKKALESKERRGISEIKIEKYCMDGLVVATTNSSMVYYRNPDNSLVTCKEYNEYLVTDI